MNGLAVARAIFAKDLQLDFRSRDRVLHMAVFAALVTTLLSIALPENEAARRAWVPALIWIVFLFTSLLGLARAFQAESESGGLVLLAQVPCDRGWVFLGKAGASFVGLVLIQGWTSVLFTVFLNVDWSGAWLAALAIAALGALGLTAAGTLLSAMATAVRAREFLLPLLLFPLALPVLVIAALMTTEALAGRTIPGVWWGGLALYDWVLVLVGYFVFDYVLED